MPTAEHDRWLGDAFGVVIDRSEQDVPTEFVMGNGGESSMAATPPPVPAKPAKPPSDANPNGVTPPPLPTTPPRADGAPASAAARTTPPPLPARPPPAPVVPCAALGDTQRTRADQFVAKMSEKDQAAVKKLFDDAKSPEERNYLIKTVASGHGAAELASFAKKIAGKDKAWMETNLHLVGGSSGKGIKQQWSDSCAPTTAEAIQGELDPLYALTLRMKSPDLTEADDSDGAAKNPVMAKDQKAMLEAGGGKVASRLDPSRKGVGMGVAPFTTLLNNRNKKNGLTFTAHTVGGDVTMDQALTSVDTALRSGLPVPVGVGNAKGAGHAALITGMDPGPPTRYAIHDPYKGQIGVFTKDQIKNGQLNVAGWTHLCIVFPPAGAPPPPIAGSAAPASGN
jgi:hypothetical protein